MKKNNKLLEIKVIPNASKNELIKTETGYKARIQSAPVDDKANEALIKMLAKKFNIPKSYVSIIKGRTSRNKLISIKDE